MINIITYYIWKFQFVCYRNRPTASLYNLMQHLSFASVFCMCCWCSRSLAYSIRSWQIVICIQPFLDLPDISINCIQIYKHCLYERAEAFTLLSVSIYTAVKILRFHFIKIECKGDHKLTAGNEFFGKYASVPKQVKRSVCVHIFEYIVL